MGKLSKKTERQLAIRNKIERLQDSLKEMIENGAEQTIKDCKKDNTQAKHYFGDKVYCRSLLIPKNTVVVGHIHKQNRICIIASGKCTFTDEYQTRTVEAPWVGEFKSGSKTAVFAHEDTVWVACLGTEIDDEDNIVDMLLWDSYEEYEEYLKLSEDI